MIPPGRVASVRNDLVELLQVLLLQLRVLLLLVLCLRVAALLLVLLRLLLLLHILHLQTQAPHEHRRAGSGGPTSVPHPVLSGHAASLTPY